MTPGQPPRFFVLWSCSPSWDGPLTCSEGDCVVPEYVLEREQWLPRPITPVFAFFADALNLEAITPPWLRFRIVSPTPIVMRTGTLIEYRLRIRGVPIRWKTRISQWSPPTGFTDEQISGPYRLWVHEHSFTPHEGGTLCKDRIRYRHFGGELVNRLFVAPELDRIFDYRRKAVHDLLGRPMPPTPTPGPTPIPESHETPIPPSAAPVER